MLQNEYLVAKIGVDTAENEPSKVCARLFSNAEYRRAAERLERFGHDGAAKRQFQRCLEHLTDPVEKAYCYARVAHCAFDGLGDRAAAVKARVQATSQGQQVPNFSENDCAADIYLAGDSYEIVAELNADVFSKFSGGFEGTFADT